MSGPLRQIPLDIRLREDNGFETFLAGDNALALAAVRSQAEGEGERQLLLWGAADTGKTHLLQAACHQQARRGAPVVYLPMAELVDADPELLQGLEGLPLVCLDDLQALVGHAAWEEALFHLVNRLRDTGGRLLMATRDNPRHAGWRLPDLHSRLHWGPVFRLQPLDDEGRLEAMRLHARQRGMHIPDEVARYLLRQFPRDLSALMDLLERIDRHSLVTQRRITVPLVREVLKGPGTRN